MGIDFTGGTALQMKFAQPIHIDLARKALLKNGLEPNLQEIKDGNKLLIKIGKTPLAALDAGYDKAFLTIMDSHVTTLITAAVLFQFGTGPVKGFAVSLSLGIIINLFTALIGTRVVFDYFLGSGRAKKISI